MNKKSFVSLFLLTTLSSVSLHAGNDPPGNLRLTQAAVTISEGVGNVSFTVQRVGGDDGAVSVQFQAIRQTAEEGTDFAATLGTLNWPDDDDDPRVFSISIVDDGVAEDEETFSVVLFNPTGGAGVGTPNEVVVTITDDDQDAPQPGTLQFTSLTYDVSEGQDVATIGVERAGGDAGTVGIDFRTEDGTATSGLDYSSISGALVWADGESGVKTFPVGIFDDVESESTETVALFLTNATGGAAIGSRNAAALRIADNDVPTGDCVQDEDTLCLGENDRFLVEVDWETPSGEAGSGRTFDIGLRDSGLIYFFGENNIEMLVKVLDACDLPQNSYWIFFAATTTVEFELRVTDTVADITKIYRNEQGDRADAVTDTQALLTCP